MANTLLSQKLAGAAQQAAPASSVSGPVKRVLAAGKRGEEVVLPILGRVWIELPGARVWQETEAAVRKEMRRLEIGDLAGDTAAPYVAELALRVLAVAVRHPDNRAEPAGTLEEWGDLDNDVISAAWHAFGDVRERLDPMAQGITDDDAIAIAALVKKKDPQLLRPFGVVRLSAWLASMGDRLSTSPTPRSSSTDSPSDSSSSTTPNQ